MNPYEETSVEMKRQSEGPKRFGKAALNVGGALGAASFIPILSRAAPFLSQYIPENLAIKGLSKISPKFGKFVKEAINGGYDFQQVKDFIGDQINESGKAKQNGNIIQQYSPELHQFMDQEIKKGRSPIEAAALAQNNSKFAKIVDKLSKDHKTPWSQIVEGIYGSGQQAGQAQQGATQTPQQGQQGKPQQGGQGQQALMAILQKIQQARGGGQ
jgi:hypothetical protein